MRPLPFLLAATLLAAAAPSPASKTYTGVITDTMCREAHAAMGITPDAKCIRDCVADGKTYKYAVLVGKEMYTLSDQETPAKFAGQKVVVTGVLYPRTQILKVETMKAAHGAS